MSIDICKELHQNFIDFAYEANSQRAFPDARDGLKPGQRACLWEMYSKGYASNKPHVKSAKISGGVIATWHPHGDVAVYETFARMSQPWINNIPEVDWHGNNGNIVIGSTPASSRYTEARLSKAVEEGMLQGLKKRNVPMILNFSEDEEWPEVFPAIMPRLLINGSQGIGVTIANTWLCYNLQEVASIIKKYIETGVLDNNELKPDFPSGGVLINADEVHKINETGRGKAIIRAKTEIKKNSILITELPYQVYVETLIDEIKALCEKGELTNIKDIYNKSDKKRLLVEIECTDNAQVVLNNLFALTSLQKSYSANQYALVGKTPKLLNLKDYLDIYIKHNVECIKTEYDFDLRKAKARLEIVEGLVKALEDIDNIIALIKNSASSSEAKDNLIIKYNFTYNQAKAIVDMKLGRLAHLEAIELNEERKDLISTIKNIENILSQDDKQLSILLERLSNFAKKFGSARKTSLTNISLKTEKEQVYIPPEDVVVIITKTGLIKKIPKNSFKVQKRNGKGVKSEEDAILSAVSTNTVDTLLLFSNLGKMYRLSVNDVPTGTNVSKGVSIENLIKMSMQEKIIAITSLYKETSAEYVVFVTKNGYLKKSRLEEYTKIKKNTGIVALNLKENDALVNISFLKEENLIILTKQGMSIRIDTRDISAIGRVAIGVKAINLYPDDEVIIALPINEKHKYLATVTENGFGKRTEINTFSIQGRGGRGLSAHHLNSLTGPLTSAVLLKDGDTIVAIGKPNSICISASDLPIVTRMGHGNVIINNSKITSVIKI